MPTPTKVTLHSFVVAAIALALSACSGGDPPPADAAACMPTTEPATATAKMLRGVLADEMKTHGMRAVLFNATVKGQPLLTTALGESAPGEPASTAMHFRLGMAAEQFVTTVLMRLVEQGKISLDDPVSKWFPNYPNAQQATVQMLARSTTGFGDYVYGPGDPARGIPSFPDLLYSDVRRVYTADELILRSQAPYQVPQFSRPGTSWEYSHTNYVMLGAILERAGASNYSSLVDEFTLRPLALRNTAYAATAQIQAPVLRAYSSERGRYEESTDWSPSWTSYSGQINTNLCDLAVWTRAFGTGALVSRASASELTAPVTVGLKANTPSLYFGMGVIVNNGWLVGDGNFFGWHTATAYHPGSDTTLVMSWTEGPGITEPLGLSRAMLQRLSALLTPQTPIVFPARS